jgi:hypothetical protein
MKTFDTTSNVDVEDGKLHDDNNAFGTGRRHQFHQ